MVTTIYTRAIFKAARQLGEISLRVGSDVKLSAVTRANVLAGFLNKKTGKIHDFFWVDSLNNVMVGAKNAAKKLEDFLTMNPKSRKDVATSFFPVVPGKSVEISDGPLDESRVDNVRQKGSAGEIKIRQSVFDVIVKNQSKFNNLLTKTAMALGISAVAVTPSVVLALVQETNNSKTGCFMVGPDGDTYRADDGECSCKGDTNPNASLCCGQAPHLQCPGDEFIPEGPPLWECPSSPPVKGCSACGSSKDPEQDWYLCLRQEDLLDTILDDLAAVDKIFNEDGEIVDVPEEDEGPDDEEAPDEGPEDGVDDSIASDKKSIYIGIGVGTFIVVTALVITAVMIVRKRKIRR